MDDIRWRTLNTPSELLDMLRRNASDRRLRLFLCACARQLPKEIICDDLIQAIERAEQFADGNSHLHEFNDFRSSGSCLSMAQDDRSYRNAAAFRMLLCKRKMLWQSAKQIAAFLVNEHVESEIHHGAARNHQNELTKAKRELPTAIIREVFGFPFDYIAIDPRWRTADVVDLAKAIYEDRAFDRMPILADALMDAGCDNDDIMQHCRGPGPHVRGCWLVDLILGKE